jgi:hypothetical protein
MQGASITLVNNDTNLSFTDSTDNNGFYRFSPIKIGLYTLTVSAPNFETRKQENIRVNVSQTEEASTGQVFTRSQLADLPLLGRNYLVLAACDGRQRAEPGQHADFRVGRIFHRTVAAFCKTTSFSTVSLNSSSASGGGRTA